MTVMKKLINYETEATEHLLTYASIKNGLQISILNIVIIHSKYFPDSDWLKAQV